MTDPECGKSGGKFRRGATTFCHRCQDATDSGTGDKAHWVQNILANPRVHVRVGDQQWGGMARVLDPNKDAEAYSNARRLAREKYGWGEGLPVEIRQV
jgi:deazaflavin-dependent oxidoreductase (nitroreductase family)